MRGQGRAALAVGVAAHRRRRLEPLRDAVVDAGEQPGRHEVGVGIGAREPVLDAAVRGVARRQAHGGAAVVDRPRRRHRHIGFGPETAVGVGSRCADRRALAERRKHATDRMTQFAALDPQTAVRAVIRRFGALEDVASRGIEHARVHMQPGSRHVAVGLRQEGRVPAVFPRHAAHHALEAQRLVAGAQRVGAVQEVHLELSRTVFGERGGRGDALRAADRVDAREHGRILVEVGHRVDLGAELATTRARQRRWLRLSGGGALSVHEVELVLDRDHRREVETVELVEHLHEDMSRVAEERPTVGLVHRDLQLRDAIVLPGHRHQRVGQRAAGAVGVALVET